MGLVLPLLALSCLEARAHRAFLEVQRWRRQQGQLPNDEGDGPEGGDLLAAAEGGVARPHMLPFTGSWLLDGYFLSSSIWWLLAAVP